jgi:4-hydroxyphenylacetate decarboxylase small subunit
MNEHRYYRCYDCSRLIHVDVFKGICRINKEKVSLDMEACKEFEPVKKCKFCRCYEQGEEEFIGKCKGKAIAYPDLIAKTCEEFDWKENLKKEFPLLSP